MTKKHFTRSTDDRMLAGVCAGLAEYFDTDANLVRALAVVLALLTGVLPFIIAYLILAVIIPEH